MTLDLRAARELCDKATPGPWVLDGPRVTDGQVSPTDIVDYSEAYVDQVDDAGWNDLKFIAASRTLVPQLLALVEELQRARNEACDLLEATFAEVSELTERANTSELRHVIAEDAEWADVMAKRDEATVLVAAKISELRAVGRAK